MPELLIPHFHLDTILGQLYIYDAYHIGGQCFRQLLGLRIVSGSGEEG